MDFEYSPKVQTLQAKLQDFMDRLVVPANAEYHREVEAGRYPMTLLDGLKARARDEGLWNLFLPGLKEDEPGTRLTNLEYAPLAEIMGRIPWSSEVFNCSAPDTGNMEILHLFATPEQRERWLDAAAERRDPLRASASPSPTSPPPTRPTSRPRSAARATSTSSTAASGSPPAPSIRTLQVLHRDGRLRRAPGRRPARPPLHGASCRWTRPGFTVVRNVPILHHHAPEGHCEVALRERARAGRRTCSARRARASRSPRRGSGRAASTTACARSASARWRSS